MDETPSIVELKQTFLTAQSRLLSQPLQPSRSWRNAHAAAIEGEGGKGKLTNAAIDEALIQANNALQQHTHRVYAPQATRHVAEQIERLYHSAGESSAVLDDPDALGLEVDFGDDTAIASLPAEWEDDRQGQRLPMEAKKYSELVARLADLSGQRKAARDRVAKLRRINKLLEPLGSPEQGDEAQAETPNHVQENLITRNSQVEKELEKMRMLLARVGGRVAHLPSKRKRNDEEPDDAVIDDVEMQEQKKAHDLLNRI